MQALTGRPCQLVIIVQDLDRSGRSFAREGIQQLMQMMRDGKITTILTYRYDRFGRNLQQALTHLEEVDSLGGQVISTTEPFDATTAIGHFMRSNTLAMAELQSMQIGEGWKRVHQYRVDRGLPTNGRERFGYLSHRTTQLRSDGALRVCPQGCPVGQCTTGFVPDPETGPVLRYLYEAYIDGRGFQAIAHEMNAQRQPTPGMVWAARSGKPERIARFAAAKWSTNTVIDLVDTGFAAGLITHNGVWLPGTHESLITNDQWGTYRRRRDSQRQVSSKARSPRWSLAGLARCGVCGGRIYCSRTNRGEGYALYCGAYRMSGTCSGVHRTRVPVEAAVALWLQQYAAQLEAAADEALRTARNAPRRDPLASERQRLRKVISSGQARAERLLDAYTDGALDLATYKTRRDDEKSQVTDAQDLLIRLSTPAPTHLTASCAINFARTWPTLSVDARRDIFGRLLREVRIHADKRVELFPLSGKPVMVTFLKRNTLPVLPEPSAPNRDQ